MAKKKTGPATPGGPSPNGLVIRCSDEWKEWLKGLAEQDRTSMAEVLDRAAIDYARKVGFKKVAPKR